VWVFGVRYHENKWKKINEKKGTLGAAAWYA
jgi:hypothetical protein